MKTPTCILQLLGPVILASPRYHPQACPSTNQVHLGKADVTQGYLAMSALLGGSCGFLFVLPSRGKALRRRPQAAPAVETSPAPAAPAAAQPERQVLSVTSSIV